MIAFVKYLGCHPLGGDLELEGVKILQKEWLLCKTPLLLLGRKHGVHPAACIPFYVEEREKRVFFCAAEWGLGKYHIFHFTPKAQARLERTVIS